MLQYFSQTYEVLFLYLVMFVLVDGDYFEIETVQTLYEIKSDLCYMGYADPVQIIGPLSP